MNTFKKIVSSPFYAMGWVGGQVKNGFDAATKAIEPVAEKTAAAATSAVNAVKATAAKVNTSVKATAVKTSEAVKATATKVKDATVTAATKTKAGVTTAATYVQNTSVSMYQSTAAWLQKTKTTIWNGLTGNFGASAAVFFRTLAGIEYIFAFVYFCLAVAGLAFPGLGMAAVTAQAFAQAGVIVMTVGLVADLVYLWFASISRYEYIPDPFFSGRRILVLDHA